MKKVVVRALTGGVIETESVGGFIQAGVMSVMNQATQIEQRQGKRRFG